MPPAVRAAPTPVPPASPGSIEAHRLLSNLAASRAASGLRQPYRHIPQRRSDSASSQSRVSSTRSRSRRRDAGRVTEHARRGSDIDAELAQSLASAVSATFDVGTTLGVRGSAESDSDDSARTQGGRYALPSSVTRSPIATSSTMPDDSIPPRRRRAGTLTAFNVACSYSSTPSSLSTSPTSQFHEPGPVTPTLLRTTRSALFSTSATTPQLCTTHAVAISQPNLNTVLAPSAQSSSTAAAAASTPAASALTRVRPSISAPSDASVLKLAAPLPSLYAVSRGRSTHVSPSRLGRRGASASVLSGASEDESIAEELTPALGSPLEEDGERSESTARPCTESMLITRRSLLLGSLASNRNSSASISRAASRLSIDLEGALFSEDEDELDNGLALTSSSASEGEECEEDYGARSPPSGSASASASTSASASAAPSRRNSIASRERRRGLRVLLSTDGGLSRSNSTSKRERGRSATGSLFGVHNLLPLRQQHSIDETLSAPTSVATTTTMSSDCPLEESRSPNASASASCSSSCERQARHDSDGALEFRARRKRSESASRRRSAEDAAADAATAAISSTASNAEGVEADDEADGEADTSTMSVDVPPRPRGSGPTRVAGIGSSASALLIRRRSMSTRGVRMARSGSSSSSSRRGPRGSLEPSPPLMADSSLSPPEMCIMARSTGSTKSALSNGSVGSSRNVGAIITTRIDLEGEADPLLCPSTGSIADLVCVPAVEWDSESERLPSHSRRGSSGWSGGERRSSAGSSAMSELSAARARLAAEAEEQEAARYTGFAAAYQERITAIGSHFRLWSRPAATEDSVATASAGTQTSEADGVAPTSPETSVDPSAAHTQSLLSTGWRHLSRLPNLILLPALTARASTASAPSTNFEPLQPSVPRGLDAHEAAARLGLPPSPTPALLGLPTSPAGSPVLSPSSRSSSPSEGSVPLQPPSLDLLAHAATQAIVQQSLGRGVVSPLEGDRDTGAYVSGLGARIDPDTELSSVVHLQTFRSRSRSASRGPRSPRTPPTPPNGRTDGLGTPPLLSLPLPAMADASGQSRPALGPRSRAFLERGHVSAPTSPSRRRASRPRRRIMVNDSDDENSDVAASMPVSPTQTRSPSPPLRRSRETDEDGFTTVRSRRGRRSGSSSAGPTSPTLAPRCSRPAAPAPVPETYSAYGSSASEEDEHSASGSGSSSNAESGAEESLRRSVRGSRSRSAGRGRAGGRASSPPAAKQPRQTAVGLFTSAGGGGSRRRHHTTRGDELFGASARDASLFRTRSSPNLTYAAAAAQAAQHLRRAAAAVAIPARALLDAEQVALAAAPVAIAPSGEADTGRGRAGEVKVVSASADAKGNMTNAAALVAPIARSVSASPILGTHTRIGRPPAPPPVVLGAGGAPLAVPPGRSASAPQAGRPSMVSNGAHLLMLSLELEMMRSRKITSSLKPRWLKARVREPKMWEQEEGGEGDATTGAAQASYLASRPRPGSMLKYEVEG